MLLIPIFILPAVFIFGIIYTSIGPGGFVVIFGLDVAGAVFEIIFVVVGAWVDVIILLGVILKIKAKAHGTKMCGV